MTIPAGGKLMVRSVLACLAMGLLLVPGCGPQEEGPTGSSTKAPPNPAPRADLGRTVEPKLPRTEDVSNVEKDLRKDLASPVIKPDVPTTQPRPQPSPASRERGAMIPTLLLRPKTGVPSRSASARRGLLRRPRRHIRPGRGRRTAGTACRAGGR